MKRAFVALLGVLLALAITMTGGHARAQSSRPEMRATVDADTVEIGDTLHLTLQATTTSSDPVTDVEHGSLAGFLVRAHTSMPLQSVMIVNGVRSERRGVTVTWQLQATRTGTFTLGPASASVGGKRFTSQALTVRVVAPGHVPPRPAARDPFGNPFSTFDPWKNMLRDPPEEPRQAPSVPTDAKLALDAPRGSVAFLHAMIDKPLAVVGEQVTLSLYVYLDAAGPDHVEFTDPHEATVSDFVKLPVVPDDADTKPAGFAMVGGHLWSVRVVRKWALFPLKAGDLEVGPMSVTIARPRVTGSAVRQSEKLVVHVGEPPIAGRPAGYVVGDVGSFKLAAEISPRDLEEGGAVSVNVELSGTGNLPATLTTPSRAELEWLDPQVRSDIAAQQDEKLGGRRTFAFVVRVRKAGDVELGDISVPFWNPDAKSYGLARVALGSVHVRARAGTDAGGSSAAIPPETLPGLPLYRATRAGAKGERRHVADSPAFWLGLGLAPLAYAVVFGAGTAARRLRARRAERATSPAREMKESVAKAEAACRGDDARAADAAIVRAVETATVALLDVHVRGARADEVAARLEGAGVGGDVAREVEALLQDCAAARFSPEAVAIDAARARWVRARRALDALEVTR